MRHAKSSWRTNDPDVRRPLSARGTRDGVVAGQYLAEFPLDVVLCSRATRAKQTWQCAQLGGASCADVRFEPDLYEARPSDVLSLVAGLPDAASTALVIGHEPTLGDVIVRLAAGSPLTEQVATKFPTAAIGVLTLPGGWDTLEPGSCTLTALEIRRG